MELNGIKNFDTYNKNMAKSLIDKIFFWDKIAVSLIVDFGCADGTLIKFLHGMDNEMKFIGYDNNADMVLLANNKFKKEKSISFSFSWERIGLEVAKIRSEGKSSCLLLSSVIHEVIHYSSKKDIDAFWKQVYDTGFEYICVRDIMPGKSIDRPGNINDYLSVIQKGNKNKIADFESVWGSMENNKNLIHYLLKYRYDDNWEREVKENYFAMYREDFLGLIDEQYEVLYHEHFVSPYVREQIKKDFGITIIDNTHLKLILKLK